MCAMTHPLCGLCRAAQTRPPSFGSLGLTMSEWLPSEEVQRLLVGVDILEPVPAGEVRTRASDAAL